MIFFRLPLLRIRFSCRLCFRFRRQLCLRLRLACKPDFLPVHRCIMKRDIAGNQANNEEHCQPHPQAFFGDAHRRRLHLVAAVPDRVRKLQNAAQR